MHKCRPLRIFILITGLICTTIGSVMFTMMDDGLPYDNRHSDVFIARTEALRRNAHVNIKLAANERNNKTQSNVNLMKLIKDSLGGKSVTQDTKSLKTKVTNNTLVNSEHHSSSNTDFVNWNIVTMVTFDDILKQRDGSNSSDNEDELWKSCVNFTLPLNDNRIDKKEKIKKNKNDTLCVISKTEATQTRSILDENNASLAQVVGIMNQDRNLQFLDIGSDVGLFSLALASLGQNVTSVNANRSTLHQLSNSLKFNGVSNNVRLLLNAVSDKFVNVTPEKQSADVNVTLQQTTFTRSYPDFALVTGIDVNTDLVTIALDDLVGLFRGKPLFINIGSDEIHIWKVLKGAKRLFMAVDVRYILIKRSHDTINQTTRKKVVELLTQFSYKPYRADEIHIELDVKDLIQVWHVDVLWIKYM